MNVVNMNLQKRDINLLEYSSIKKIIIWQGFPYLFQFIMLLIFVFLIFMGWQVYTPPNVADKPFAKTNLVTLIIWGIW